MGLGLDQAGNALFPAVDEDVFLEWAKQDLARNAVSDRLTFRGGQPPAHSINRGDPGEAGWTFLIRAGDPNRTEILAALRPLAELRGMKNPMAPLEFGGGPREGWLEWINTNYDAPSLANQQVPAYVLIVGSPSAVPFDFQSLLSTVAIVGRLDFDSDKDLRAYVEKVLRLEGASGPIVDREVVLFAPDAGLPDPTYFSRKYMAEPLAEHVDSYLRFDTVRLFGDQATKARLIESLRGKRPAFVYSASHGLGLTDGSDARKRELNGSICCQRSKTDTSNSLFSAEDVPLGESFLEGSVFFQFACFGYGTPTRSYFSHWRDNSLRQWADADFVAALPKRLLSHPRGPIAYVGHLDSAFIHGFTDPAVPFAAAAGVLRWGARVAPFKQAVTSILSAKPTAMAMDAMTQRHALCNAELVQTYDQMQRGEYTWTADRRKRFVDRWITRSDAQNYMVLGDPAARAWIPEPATQTRP
jgi:hypothetical protein